jgi:hypothetical protein
LQPFGEELREPKKVREIRSYDTGGYMLRFDSREMHERIKSKLKTILPADEAVSEIPANNGKLDELVFRRLQALSENGVLSENPHYAASMIAANLLGDGPEGEPRWEVKRTRLFDRIGRSINRLEFQHRVLKVEGGEWKLSDSLDKPISSFRPVDPKVPGYQYRGNVILPRMD